MVGPATALTHDDTRGLCAFMETFLFVEQSARRSSLNLDIYSMFCSFGVHLSAGGAAYLVRFKVVYDAPAAISGGADLDEEEEGGPTLIILFQKSVGWLGHDGREKAGMPNL